MVETPKQMLMVVCRLLDELVGEHGAKKLITPALCESMDLTPDVVEGVMHQASSFWEAAKGGMVREAEREAKREAAAKAPRLTLVPPGTYIREPETEDG